MQTVRAVLLGAPRDGDEHPLDAAQDQRAGSPDLQREGGVDDVGGRQSVVNPASFGAELLGDGVDEGGEIVVGRLLDLGNAFG